MPFDFTFKKKNYDEENKTAKPYDNFSVDEEQLERAAVLAEKFKDFELLIEMCIKSNDLERLYSYIDKYMNEVRPHSMPTMAMWIVFLDMV